MTRLRGRSPRGKRLHAAAPYSRWRATTMIGSVRQDGSTTCMTVEGAMNAEVFARDDLDDFIDAAVYTSELEVAKPHADAFQAIAQALDVSPQESVFVGDRLWDDVLGAQRVGMRTIWIPHSRIPEEQVPDGTATPDATATRLLDIFAIVEQWQALEPDVAAANRSLEQAADIVDLDMPADAPFAGLGRAGHAGPRRLARLPRRRRAPRPRTAALCRARHHAAGPHTALRRALLRRR